MLYVDLPEVEKEAWQGYTANLRALQGTFQTMLNQTRAVNDQYNAEIVGIAANLDDPEVIPNPTFLAGSGELTKAEHTTLTSWSQTALELDTDPHRQLRVSAAGVNAGT